MPARINHIKIATPDPRVIDTFLREVCDVPEGWPMGDRPASEPLPPGTPLGPGGSLTHEQVMARRGGGGGAGGLITGDASSRQFQITSAAESKVWAICIATRHIEEVYDRCLERGVPACPITVADWNEQDNIRNFFCIVADIMFEVIRVEPKAPA